jgi:hypothetical protein
MTADQFWEIVDDVHIASSGDMDAKRKLLNDKLSNLSTDEIQSFDDHFDGCMDTAYTWELWAAAYIIGGGCSDDAFSDFRATLISTGRSRFESVLATPDSLADLNPDPDNDFYEGYQYVAFTVYKGRTGKLPVRSKPHPKDPSGTAWEEKRVAAVHPKLAKKFGWTT